MVATSLTGPWFKWPKRCIALKRRSARRLWALDKRENTVGAGLVADLSNCALRLGCPGRLDRARQLCHLGQDRSEDPDTVTGRASLA
jgi:hypothetical protein